ALRAPLRARRPGPPTAVRRAAPASGRLPGLVPAARARGRVALVRPPSHAPARCAAHGCSPLRPRPVPNDTAPPGPCRGVSISIHRSRDAPGDGRLVGPPARGLLPPAKPRIVLGG